MSAADASKAIGAITGKLKDGFAAPYSIPGVYNFDPALLPHWRKALARVRTGAGIAKVAMVGDSTTAGVGTGAAGAFKRATSHPTMLAAYLNKWVSASAGSIFGASQSTQTTGVYTGIDPRVVFAGSSWDFAILSVGGIGFRNLSGTDKLTFTPVDAFDTAVIFVATGGSSPVVNVSVDGGAATSFSSIPTSSTSSITFTTTAATHALEIARASGGGLTVLGVLTYNSTAPAVCVMNMGWSGSKTDDWAPTVNSFDPANALAVVAPDLTFLNLTINDILLRTDPATSMVNLQTLITKAQLSGDVVLCVPVPSDGSVRALSTQAAYRAAIRALGASNGVPVIDFPARFVSQAAANAAGLYTDTLHPNGLGAGDMAQGIERVLRAT